MSNICEINKPDVIESYRQIAKYCFIDNIGWTDRFIPSKNPNDKIWGAFESGELISGMGIKDYNANLFDNEIKMAGISAVCSYPQSRDKGYIRDIFNKLLPELFKSGYDVSTLYPFKYSYYNKFGYGNAGGMNDFVFTPDMILKNRTKDYKIVKIFNNQKHRNDIKEIYNSWINKYTLGIYLDDYIVDSILEATSMPNNHLFMFYDLGDNPKGLIFFTLEPEKMFSTKLDIKRIVWDDKDSLFAIFNLLSKNRDQCHEIRFMAPKNIPVWLLLKDQRPTQSVYYQWMFRPINVLKILELKTREVNFKGTATISIEDNIIEENSGTYQIIGYKVLKNKLTSKNIIPLSIFSSLLFGELTFAEVLSFYNIKIDEPEDIAQLFSKKNDIYISEFF